MNVLGDRVLELGPTPDAGGPYKNFKLTRDSDGVAWLLFDREGTSANTLSADLIARYDPLTVAPAARQSRRSARRNTETPAMTAKTMCTLGTAAYGL